MATIEETTDEILFGFIDDVDKQIARISTAATNIATAIENQGVTVPAGTTIDGYASLIGQILVGGVSLFLLPLLCRWKRRPRIPAVTALRSALPD